MGHSINAECACRALRVSGGPDEHRLAVGSAEGQVYVWDAKKGKVLTCITHHSKPVYRLCWNPHDVNALVSTSSDCTAVVFTPEGKIVRKYKHPMQVYGCEWSPFNKDVIATGCHDNRVRVWDISDTSQNPTHELQGHKARVFNVAWSPFLPNVLASGSDDKTIRVWEVGSKQPCKVLNGHKRCGG